MTATISEVLAGRFLGRRHALAAVCDGEELRYGELDAMTAGAAAALGDHGVPPAATVGVTLERGLPQVACLVAIVRAGRAFCFLDRRSPPAWNRDVIARAGITHVVGTGDAALGAEVSWIAADALLGEGRPALAAAARPDDPVYVNFSSGTTGAPKVIPCTHRGVLGFCHAPRHLPAGPDTRFVYSSPLTFDASQLELWMPLLNGGCVVVNGGRHLTPEAVRRLIRRDGANAMWLTSSLLNALVDVDPSCLAGIRHLIAGGEELSPQHVAAVYRADPAVTVFNGYGPTETTIITTVHEIPRDHDVALKIPIGRAIAGNRLVVVQRGGGICEDGEVGELVVTGAGLSPGYLGDAALTAEKFASVLIDGVPVRGYWTGDLVSRDRDGVFHYHGREDDQLKVRGHRVALSEVASAFAAHSGIRSCAVIAVAGDGGKQLALCYVPSGASPDPAELAAFGRARLPEFMVPRAVLAVDQLPLTSSGKVDRGALAGRVAAALAPDPVEEGGGVAGLVRGMAGLPGWRLDASFFDAGGDSLRAIRLVGALERLVGTEGGLLEALYRTPTLAHLVTLLPPDLPARAQAGGDDLVDDELAPIPLPPAQRSMVYPELFHGDRTYNNVVYLFQEHALGRGEAALAEVHEALLARFPLLGCVVIDGDDGFAFAAAQPARPGVDPEVTEHPDVASCVAHHLARPISLFEGPLLTLFRTRIAGRLHHGVRLHHILGDHIGQTAILRAIESLARGAAPPLPPASPGAASRRLARRAELEPEACAGYWAAQTIAPPELAARPTTGRLTPVVRRRRLPGARRDRAPSEQLLGWLAAAGAALEAVFDVREPVVHCLFSLREDEAGLGFQTCLAPVALTAERVADGLPRPALLHVLLATRRHCLIGLEEILLASGLERARIPFLFNFVELRPEDHIWWGERLVEAPSEPCKTELDLTVIRSGEIFDLTVTTTHDAAMADAVLDHLAARTQ